MTMHSGPLARPGLWTRVAPWLAIQALPKHLANILPFALGTALAYWQSGRVDWIVFGLALVALLLLTDGTYIASEYFAYGNDRLNLRRIGRAIVAFALAIPVGLFPAGGSRDGSAHHPSRGARLVHRVVLLGAAGQGGPPRVG